MNRREFLRDNSIVTGAALAASVLPATASSDTPRILLDPAPRFEISPYLYMQMMEPLGVTDSSVAAAWDYQADDWRRDFMETTSDLAPGCVRFGGLFSRYYKWREGVGPVASRPWMRNYNWGGWESNRVGTHEFVDFCRRVGAEPLYCVNFMSDGRTQYANEREGNRTADAQEAADWVSYANDPDNVERKRNGVASPYNIKLWQLGNETSYGRGGFSKEESIQHTIEFARAMKRRDPSIHLIGWGDRHGGTAGELWAGDLVKQAGEYLDYVAIHMMGQHPQRMDTVLVDRRWYGAPEQAWQELLELASNVERRVAELEQALAEASSPASIAITEGHLSLPPANSSPLLREWMTGVYHARSMNIYQRHGARVRISTAADFNGTRWMSNALITPVPQGQSYLLPAGSVMRLFKRHNGSHAVALKLCPADLDVAASRAGDKYFLHVANLNYGRAVETSFAVEGTTLRAGRAFAIAPDNLREYVDQDRTRVFVPVETAIPADPGQELKWRFPAGSVTAVELES
jgi:alpha-N-arabinofuranosidase